MKTGGMIKGEKLRALMKQHNLSGDQGADVVAKMLHTTRSTVQSWYTRGIPINEYELLEYKLKD